MAKELLKSSRQIERFSARLLFKMILLVLASVSLAGTVLFVLSLTPIAPSYVEAIFSVNSYKMELLRKSLYIHSIFTALMLAGVIVLSLVYSHRVAGPLYRIRIVARTMAAGRLDEPFTIRSKDVVHSLADIMNEISQKYGQKHQKLSGELDVLHEGLVKLCDSAKAGKGDAVRENIDTLKSTAQSILSSLMKLKI